MCKSRVKVDVNLKAPLLTAALFTLAAYFPLFGYLVAFLILFDTAVLLCKRHT